MAVEPRLDAWLDVLVKSGGTALLMTAGAAPLMRIGQALVPMPNTAPLSGEEIEVIARTQIRDQYGDRLHSGQEVDFSFTWRSASHFRGTAFYQRRTCALSIRQIPTVIPTFGDLGVPAAVGTLLDRSLDAAAPGLLIVGGSSQPALSAALAAAVDHVNSCRPCHIVTVEDPIDYEHTSRRAAVSQREVGTDTESVSAALWSARRAEADMVVINHISDPADIAAVLDVAEQGRLVVTSVLAESASQAVSHLVDAFAPASRYRVRLALSACLLGVLQHDATAAREPGPSYELVAASSLLRSSALGGRAELLADALDGPLTVVEPEVVQLDDAAAGSGPSSGPVSVVFGAPV